MVSTPPPERRTQRRAMTLSASRWLPRDRRARAALAFAVLLLVVASIAALVHRPTHHNRALPPTPPSPLSSTSIGRSTSTPPTARAKPKPLTCRPPAKSPLGGTAPVQICIPAIRVQASVMQLGLNGDRTVQVPPLSRVGDAGWYKYSAPPGRSGPTVILGHVDSAAYGAGVFFRLGQLRAGDSVSVGRADGRVATYRIDRVDEISKHKFPSQAVYGPTSGPAVRLVTCGGRFDSSTGNYEDNIIAYGTLSAVGSS